MSGIHHITAIAGRADRNLHFFTRVLGLRLVKKTVNFDDPGTYHLYYGDEHGHPGTILTFFPWENAAQGHAGAGMVNETAFRVPASSIGYWTHRLIDKGVAPGALVKRFGEPVITFSDPDGMAFALVGVDGAEREPGWTTGEIPTEHAIRGFQGITLLLDKAAPTAAVLTDVFGFEDGGRDGDVVRYRAKETGTVVDLRETARYAPGRMGRGSVHHIAFRAADDAAQAAMAQRLIERHGLQVTGQKDRNYFRSVYLREPGGVLFEIATDEPGFAVDEPIETLGSALKLPAFLEPHRKELEAVLPDLTIATQEAA